MARKDDLGRAGEDRAAAELRRRGYRILDRNWRCAIGEIDIVAERDGVVAVIEVKTRSSDRHGHPLEAIDGRKLSRLWRLASTWAREHPDQTRWRRLRVDAIALIGPDPHSAEIDHVTDLR